MKENWLSLASSINALEEKEKRDKEEADKAEKARIHSEIRNNATALEKEISVLVEQYKVKDILEQIRDQVWKTGEIKFAKSSLKVPDVYDDPVRYVSGLRLEASFERIREKGFWSQWSSDTPEYWVRTGKDYIETTDTSLAIVFKKVENSWVMRIVNILPDPSDTNSKAHISNIHNYAEIPIDENTNDALKNVLANTCAWRMKHGYIPLELTKKCRQSKDYKKAKPSLWKRITKSL